MGQGARQESDKYTLLPTIPISTHKKHSKFLNLILIRFAKSTAGYSYRPRAAVLHFGFKVICCHGDSIVILGAVADIALQHPEASARKEKANKGEITPLCMVS